ncbi:hypothetical protein KVR01_007716 [Diaporthe batatas]|uniref:uncharacterized protein n=1 Tax=Diaporthe batatas TaxID=748121 RepID=UPI001D05754E|nr:uncharacterized protein KVR01_007716 [Diaporthe batatas]KAG8161951.1 hypothetical protein KVR01_007716 [Diaporthe batatas]
MSSGTLRRLVLSATGDASPAAALALPRRTIPSLSSSLTSCPPSTRQSGAAPLQLRCFHPTPATRLYIPNEVVFALAGGGILLARFLLKRVNIVIARTGPGSMTFPPISWVRSCDQKTRHEVATIVTAGFDMAMRKPTRLRDQAYREASFQVPHEIARLNTAAPRFKIEEMAPLTCVRKELGRLRRGDPDLEFSFDIEKDAQLFLYFPNDSPKAAAAFLAINTKFDTRVRNSEVPPTDEQARLLAYGMALFKLQCRHWADKRPEILRRIGPALLPVIISFRGTACGLLYDMRSGRLVRSGSDTASIVNFDQNRR